MASSTPAGAQTPLEDALRVLDLAAVRLWVDGGDVRALCARFNLPIPTQYR